MKLKKNLISRGIVDNETFLKNYINENHKWVFNLGLSKQEMKDFETDVKESLDFQLCYTSAFLKSLINDFCVTFLKKIGYIK